MEAKSPFEGGLLASIGGSDRTIDKESVEWQKASLVMSRVNLGQRPPARPRHPAR